MENVRLILELYINEQILPTRVYLWTAKNLSHVRFAGGIVLIGDMIDEASKLQKGFYLPLIQTEFKLTAKKSCNDNFCN